MIIQRVTELSKPLHQRISNLEPKTQRLLHYMESGMCVVLITSLLCYL